jgi:poly(beta-D-mannuronate) lyase
MKSPLKHIHALSLMALLLWGCAAEPEEPMRDDKLTPPFNVSMLREIKGARDDGSFKCPAPPEAMQDLKFTSIYGGKSANSSVVDEESQQAYKEKTVPIRKFEERLALLANRYVRSNPARTETAQCALSWLKSWAQQDALMGDANNTGEFVRKWTLASASVAYIQIRDEKSLSKDDKKIVRKWLHKVAKQVVIDFSKHADKKSRLNNHLYWAAWGVAMAGVATNDATLFDWGIEKARVGIAQITKEGTLPLEVDRGRMAYNYHVYAAIPLFMLANAGFKNGVDLYAENDKALERLAGVILKNAENGAPDFERLTGEKQVTERAVTSNNMSWLEAWYAHSQSPAAKPWIDKFRPLYQTRIGGDATLLYAKD